MNVGGYAVYSPSEGKIVIFDKRIHKYEMSRHCKDEKIFCVYLDIEYADREEFYTSTTKLFQGSEKQCKEQLRKIAEGLGKTYNVVSLWGEVSET